MSKEQETAMYDQPISDDEIMAELGHAADTEELAIMPFPIPDISGLSDRELMEQIYRKVNYVQEDIAATKELANGVKEMAEPLLKKFEKGGLMGMLGGW